MISFINIDKSEPYSIFQDYYSLAKDNKQKNIEAIYIASFSHNKNYVDSRIVNLKYIKKDEWIFFTSYESPKFKQIENLNNISCIIFWNAINVQIRIRAIARKTDEDFSNKHFSKRSKTKNALSISSRQSSVIESYDKVKINYKNALNSSDLSVRPKNWGGVSFFPYYFEFWEGRENRVNKRVAFNKIKDSWKFNFLQP